MKKIITFLLAIVLACSGLFIANDTQVSAATNNNIGATITTSGCKIDKKSISYLTESYTVWNQLLNNENGSSKTGVFTITGANKKSYITIKAKEKGILYIQAYKNDNSNLIKGYTDKKFSDAALGFASTSANQTSFSKLVLNTQTTNSDVFQYPINANETLYLKIPANVKLSIHLLKYTSSYSTIISSATMDSSSMNFGVIIPSTTSEHAKVYYMQKDKLSNGYNIIKNMQDIYQLHVDMVPEERVRISSMSKNMEVSVYNMPIDNNYKTLDNPIALEGLIVYDFIIDNKIVFNILPFKVKDARRFVPQWYKNNLVPEPIFYKKGTNVIIGQIPDGVASDKVTVKINNKTFSAIAEDFPIIKKNFSTGPSDPAVIEKELYGMYCIVLKSNLKSGDKIQLYYGDNSTVVSNFTVD